MQVSEWDSEGREDIGHEGGRVLDCLSLRCALVAWWLHCEETIRCLAEVQPH